MKGIVIISSQKTVANEHETLRLLFENGLLSFHLRKPGYKKNQLKEYLDRVPSKYHNRIVLHSHHDLILKYNLQGIHFNSKNRKKSIKTSWKKYRLRRKKPSMTFSTSFHKLVNIDVYAGKYDYVFLSPIFDSISKKDYQSGFSKYSLDNAIKHSKYDVYALGGIDETKIHEILELGFSGAALYGHIWTNENPVQAFIDFKAAMTAACKVS